jgi:DNA-binding transcriptional LysR family regulator
LIYEFSSRYSEEYPMRPLPSELLGTFVVVARTGSFTAAAERVSLSQSTVSQHVRRLEDLVGQPLFDRGTRHVKLSPHGETLHRYAEKILALMEEAMTSLCGHTLNGTVRVGLPEDFASTRLTTALASFAQRNPQVELVIGTGLSGDLFRELDEGKYDLVFAKRISGSQRGTVVRTEPLFWCGSPASPLSGGEAVLSLAVHPEPSIARRRMLDALKAADRPFRLAMVSSNVMVIQAAVMAGLGISAFGGYVIPHGMVRLDHDLPPLGVLEYVIDRQASISQAAQALCAVLTDAAREL